MAGTWTSGLTAGAVGQELIYNNNGEWANYYKGEIVSPYDIPPASADTMDDEFRGVSISNEWTASTVGTPTYGTSNGGLVYSSTTSETLFLTQALSASGTFEVCFELDTLVTSLSNVYCYFGLTDGTPVANNESIHFYFAGNDTNSKLKLTEQAVATRYGEEYQMGKRIYLKIEYDANDDGSKFYLSWTGKAWTEIYDGIPGFGTPNKLFIGFQSFNNYVNAATCWWFRKTA